MHKNRGWSDIGYNIVIRRSGKVDVGRPLDCQGAHVKGHNHNTLGICLVGGLNDNGDPEDNFTPEQFASLEKWIIALDVAYPGTEIKGPRDFSPDIDGDGVVEEWEWLKQCPCFDAGQWARDVGLR